MKLIDVANQLGASSQCCTLWITHFNAQFTARAETALVNVPPALHHDARYLYLIGRTELALGKNAEARTEYLAVLAAHPELTAINRAIAFTYGREKSHPEALKYLEIALAANPNDAELLQLAAASAMELSDYPRAMGYLGRIDESALTDPDLMVNAAMNLLNRRRSVDATIVLTRVIARFPTAADAFFYRGYATMQAGKPAEAKADLEQYLKLAPPDAPLVTQAKDMLSRIP